MSIYLFSREELFSVVDHPIFLEFEEAFLRLYPHSIYNQVSLENPSKDRYDIEYWAFRSSCMEQAFLITYPIVKILFPESRFRIFSGKSHAVVVNDKFDISTIVYFYSRDMNDALIFDPMAIVDPDIYNINLLLEDIEIYGEYIEEEDMSEYFYHNLLGNTYDDVLDLFEYFRENI